MTEACEIFSCVGAKLRLNNKNLIVLEGNVAALHMKIKPPSYITTWSEVCIKQVFQEIYCFCLRRI